MSYSMRNCHNYLYLSSYNVKFCTLFNGDSRLIEAYFNVTKATAYRWIKAGQPTNPTALRLLDIAASGFLPCVKEWDGFYIFSGRIITPRGFDILPSELEMMCEELGRLPSAKKLMDQPRLFKPWRDREPEFVKELKMALNTRCVKSE